MPRDGPLAPAGHGVVAPAGHVVFAPRPHPTERMRVPGASACVDAIEPRGTANMKVVVCFGPVKVVVPCRNGSMLVQDLINEAVRRYKKATNKRRLIMSEREWEMLASRITGEGDSPVPSACLPPRDYYSGVRGEEKGSRLPPVWNRIRSGSGLVRCRLGPLPHVHHSDLRGTRECRTVVRLGGVDRMRPPAVLRPGGHRCVFDSESA
ncbi:unnamed protein product [Darwinula stevensoni]|uniref:Par3/HAL N-terminal domain-containing protein n=1 Tax=Darwinula stevensoni TaxID=69355 RepID=A0A7R8X6B1_9CRUS|nr:unnamed protein product [Darwinula stevensoni]CAG0885575.1 unnamed protein product [Darwinula stevensoni]